MTVSGTPVAERACWVVSDVAQSNEPPPVLVQAASAGAEDATTAATTMPICGARPVLKDVLAISLPLVSAQIGRLVEVLLEGPFGFLRPTTTT